MLALQKPRHIRHTLSAALSLRATSKEKSPLMCKCGPRYLAVVLVVIGPTLPFSLAIARRNVDARAPLMASCLTALSKFCARPALACHASKSWSSSLSFATSSCTVSPVAIDALSSAKKVQETSEAIPVIGLRRTRCFDNPACLRASRHPNCEGQAARPDRSVPAELPANTPVSPLR